MSKSDSESRALELLERVGIPEQAYKYHQSFQVVSKRGLL